MMKEIMDRPRYAVAVIDEEPGFRRETLYEFTNHALWLDRC